MNAAKETIRAEYKERRKALFSDEKCRKIAERFFESDLIAYDTFFVYLSFSSEADTQAVIAGLLARNKRVLVPKIVEDRMIAVPYTDELIAGKYGISEPATGNEELPQVCLTPLLAFDGAFNRLGYGGGYYDKYFASHPGVLRIGLAFEGQRTNFLPAEEGDIPLDGVITERRIDRTSPFGKERDEGGTP